MHVQEPEIDFVTSRKNEPTRRAFEADDINNVLSALYEGRVSLHNGSARPWPELSIHLVGGHAAGSQIVRVDTKRGRVVLAADPSHFYENMDRGIPFHGTCDVAQRLASFDTMRLLANSDQPVVPGHDPEVMKRYRRSPTTSLFAWTNRRERANSTKDAKVEPHNTSHWNFPSHNRESHNVYPMPSPSQ